MNQEQQISWTMEAKRINDLLIELGSDKNTPQSVLNQLRTEQAKHLALVAPRGHTRPARGFLRGTLVPPTPSLEKREDIAVAVLAARQGNHPVLTNRKARRKWAAICHEHGVVLPKKEIEVKPLVIE